MRKFKQQLKSPVVIRWFFSYLFILLLSIIAGFTSSFYARNISFKQADQIQRGLMAQVQMDIDSTTQSTYNLLHRMTFNKNISRVSADIGNQDRYSIYLATSDINTYLYENNSIASIFLFDPDSKMILSNAGHLDAKYFYSLYFEHLVDDYESFEEKISADQYRNELYLETNRGTPLIAFTQKIIPTGTSKELLATIILNPDYLINRMEYLRWDDSISIAIQFENEDIIAQTGPVEFSEAINIDAIDNNQVILETIDGNEYGVFVTHSNSTSWNYIMYVPTDLMYQGVDRIALITVITIILLTSIGMYLAYIFSIKNYRPLKETIDVMSDHMPTPLDAKANKNEYAWLKNAWVDYSDRFQQNVELLKNYNIYLKNNLLFRLLETPFSIDRDHQEYQKTEWDFPHPYFLVLNFYYTDAQAITIAPSIEEGKQKLSISILSAFETDTKNQYKYEIIDLGDRVSAILNLEDRSSQTKEDINTLVHSCLDEIEQTLGVEINASIGAIHTGIAQVYISSNEAKEAGAFISTNDRDRVVLYEDIKNLRSAYSYPMELEQQIINHMLQGEEELAIAVAKRVFRQNESSLNSDMYKCLVLDMLGTIIKAANQSDAPDIVNQIDISNIVSNNESQKHIYRAISVICQESKRKAATVNKNATLVNNVKQYVHEFFSDTELNVSNIGKYFYLTPAYLSSIFKDETGISLLEYINMVRIERSKQLLTRNMNVNDVALAVGFKASGSFIRSFKKIVGTTPGQWAAQAESNEQIAL